MATRKGGGNGKREENVWLRPIGSFRGNLVAETSRVNVLENDRVISLEIAGVGLGELARRPRESVVISVDRALQTNVFR